MHIASVAVLRGPATRVRGGRRDGAWQAPPLVPRYRQVVRFVPYHLGRPVWVDDPHFNLEYHVRHTALPSPGGEAELRRLVGRVMGRQLDRAKPLWEIWVVEGLEQGAGRSSQRRTTAWSTACRAPTSSHSCSTRRLPGARRSR